ncbi:MAG TPA: hypothetical protein VFB66_31865 [Tepidisphaeraceae bacterium]|nr:hypothetical protein [Tepidisphaeraceae bacterium]
MTSDKWQVTIRRMVVCALCGREVDVHESYVVQIDVFADPSMPAVSSEELAAADFDEAMAELLEQMRHLTADQLQDDVHRRFEYRLCRRCQRGYLLNPLGKPREPRAGRN